ncbi:sugar ABC transporter substrate-binding protein [Paraburkholderia sp. LEh10]|uniref:sugar ABC transporter substrate-binding protein n=1 Tax=Paraburkholderia sp. LEh10 TaxID=2821353 RepID=UPI001AE8C143|nr:sugar ABC transporter substrate-binding protein [Paraburkholderia sp. LEh10]MBP0589467.1 sugar ABC transporter substrate-binding protein [Paraburkholderia sp. LEh10]
MSQSRLPGGNAIARTFTVVILSAMTLMVSTEVLAQQKAAVVGEVTSLENEYFSNWDRGAKSAADALGLNYRALTDGGDPTKQLQNYESQLRAGTKLFFGNAQNVGNIPAFVSKVRDAGGHYVGVWDSLPWYHPLDVPNGAYAGFFAPDDSANAYTIAKLLFQKMGGKGNVVHLTGYPGSSPDVARNDGFDRALKESPGIKLVASQQGNWNQVDSRKVMEDIIVAHPKIDGVFAQNDSEAIGAMQALDDAGIRIPIVGIDGNAETIKLIKDGRILATVSNLPEWQAGYAMVRAYDIAKGWKPSPTEAMMYTGVAVITAANVSAYQKVFNGGPLPFDWKKMSHVLHPNDWDPQNRVWPMDVVTVWERAKTPKPSGYQLSAAYQDALKNKDDQKVRAQYEEHNKQKLSF